MPHLLQSPVGEAWTLWRSVDGGWYDANPYGNRYRLGNSYAVHNGADLNLPGNRDREKPVYAIDDAVVTFARRAPNTTTWGKIVVLKHEWGYSRYAHLANFFVQVGQTVSRGAVIGVIGNTGLEHLPGNDHLHFDVSMTQICGTSPLYWAGDNREMVMQHFVDPYQLILGRKEMVRARVISSLRLRIRKSPSLSAPVVGFLPPGVVVEVLWSPVWSRLPSEGYIATRWLEVLP